jgi:hypothetical protein
MAAPDKKPVTFEELLVSSLAQTDALAKLLVEKGLITREEFVRTGDVSEVIESHGTVSVGDNENEMATQRTHEKKTLLLQVALTEQLIGDQKVSFSLRTN